MLPELPFVSIAEGQRLADEYMLDAANQTLPSLPPQPQSTQPVPLLPRPILPLHLSNMSWFHVTRVYQGHPSYVPPPDREVKAQYKAFSPLDLVQEVKDIKTVILPWPNFSSWL
jgi:hypothetical protein